MEAEITDMLVNLIPQGGFAGFLFYLFHSVKNELATHRTEAKEEQKILRDDHQKAEQALRDRYMKVIDDLQREKEQFRGNLQQKMSQFETRLNVVENKLVEITTRLESILEKIHDLRK